MIRLPIQRQRTSELRPFRVRQQSGAILKWSENLEIKATLKPKLEKPSLSPLTTDTEIGRTSVLDFLIKINVEGKRKGSHSPLRRKRFDKKSNHK